MKPHTKECWCIPPSQSGEFVAAMEDVLKLYEEPYDPARPVICMDETNKQLVGETRTPMPASPGRFVARRPIILGWDEFDHLYQIAYAFL